MSEADKRILLAEDEAHIAKLVEFKLSRDGFELSVAENGQVAIDRLKDGPWALIILDVMMPVCDGWQVLQAIREDSALGEVPVLMLTAKGQQKDMANAAEMGATHYLKKPFDPGELSETVKRLTSGQEG